MKDFALRVSKVLCLVLPLAGCAARPDPASPWDGLAGRPVAELADGDLLFPRFSPDGRTLAYSEVIVGEEGETTRLLLRNLETGETSVLLDADAAERYGVYASFVTDLRWQDDRHLEATLHDGDVGSTGLTFDVDTRKVVREESSEGEVAEEEPLPEPFPGFRKLPEDVLAVFPKVAFSRAWNPPVVIPGRSLVFQVLPEEGEESSPVWWVDLRWKSRTLLSTGDGQLRGGFSLGRSSFFLLAKDRRANLFFVNDDGEARKLISVPSTAPELAFAPLSRRKALLMVRTRPLREKGENPLYQWDGTTLKRVQGPADLVDLDAHPKTGRVAFCSWNGDRRRITVHRLR